ncbi:hypothetical protein [Candidatus Kuenenia stuttgartiensis]|uniref:hypothetical protein n=1 Tax=Kuenenia stuttgartiensis TaxID=174633 RepID=UPI0013EC8C17|nr:hypothetical protein [Candidatus Kuenenia stuttgartiensis]
MPAHGWVGARATSFLAAHFAKQNTNSVGVQSEGEAEGGCGGNSASPEPKRSPAALLVQSRPPKKSFVFLLEEKIGRAQIKNCEQNFSLSERALASGGGAERQNSAFGFSVKKVRISFSVRSQIVCCEFVASALRASAGRLYSICQDFLGSIATFCESKTRFAVAKQQINEVYEPILFIPPKAESKAIIFKSPKAI